MLHPLAGASERDGTLEYDNMLNLQPYLPGTAEHVRWDTSQTCSMVSSPWFTGIMVFYRPGRTVQASSTHCGVYHSLVASRHPLRHTQAMGNDYCSAGCLGTNEMLRCASTHISGSCLLCRLDEGLTGGQAHAGVQA
jgi:hypothetical protein